MVERCPYSAGLKRMDSAGSRTDSTRIAGSSLSHQPERAVTWTTIARAIRKTMHAAMTRRRFTSRIVIDSRAEFQRRSQSEMRRLSSALGVLLLLAGALAGCKSERATPAAGPEGFAFLVYPGSQYLA